VIFRGLDIPRFAGPTWPLAAALPSCDRLEPVPRSNFPPRGWSNDPFLNAVLDALLLMALRCTSACMRFEEPNWIAGLGVSFSR